MIVQVLLGVGIAVVVIVICLALITWIMVAFEREVERRWGRHDEEEV